MKETNEPQVLREQMQLLLQKAGWYPGRHVDLSGYKRRCEQQGVELFPAAQAFLEEFSGIDNEVHFKYYTDHEEAQEMETGWHEYDFNFEPDAVERFHCKAELEIIIRHAQEDCYCLGLSGYYYPAVTAIGRSGKLYLLHDYNPQVLVFDSLQASMSHELGHLQLVESSLYGENRLLLPTVAGLKWLPENVPNPFVEE
ncbi:hypothetical protein GCM10010912_53330 [Paenibacillus albidus]|uniref:Uncharacterized protein n=1 Tax=Paenibacillus albidus TaxID=2041023 RepID=A0A917CXQ0_9BACL|nr:SUKH-3 domain-containing protein [Paenibacillus albidus]GGG01829.1 hypothetical protein GCM10010912_53330 [Paenibacillus albidus]